MRKLLVLCLAMCLVAFAANAFAEVQNIKVSGDLTISGVSREDFDLGSDLGQAEQDSGVIMSQTRLRVDADLTDNVGVSVRLINERDWGNETRTTTYTTAGADTVAVNNDNDDIDIDLAYVTLKELLYSPLTVTLGRQELMFGNGLIIGDVDTNRTTASDAGIANRDLSLRKAFDAVRATLDYDPLVLDLVYSKIDENAPLGLGGDNDDIDLLGVNATYNLGDDYNTNLEGYFWYKLDKSVEVATVAGNNKADKVYNPGFRISTNPIERLNVQTEFAWQLGTKDLLTTTQTTRKREAMAAQVLANYALDMDMNPVLGASFTYLSGDEDPYEAATTNNNNDEYTAWDPMFENQTSGNIINVLFPQTSTKVLNLNASAEPMEDIKVRLDYTTLWLDKDPNIGRYGFGPNNNILLLLGLDGNTSQPIMTGETWLGWELDTNLTYDYTEDVQFGLLYGYFVAGDAFDGQNRENATSLIASCKVLF